MSMHAHHAVVKKVMRMWFPDCKLTQVQIVRYCVKIQRGENTPKNAQNYAQRYLATRSVICIPSYICQSFSLLLA